MTKAGDVPTNSDITEVMSKLTDASLDVIKTENLYDYNGEPGYSLGQGQ
jgi:isocitrate dehydrogenase